VQRSTTEIVISDMIILDSKGAGGAVAPDSFDIPDSVGEGTDAPSEVQPAAQPVQSQPAKKAVKEKKSDEIKSDGEPEDIPF
jgi:hypothetical protein